ncbi:hypothetical protein HPB50_016590 [Hyalomma asiaticum]|uniref:Uncharacterized protein n=1 Tax=Hyalomma asiaticum TaxID=266040 RepID=A0ACB7SD57_HYAAI|nr:hypothetical protein HPB50_016590 [Hyalomma asiaticum]
MIECVVCLLLLREITTADASACQSERCPTSMGALQVEEAEAERYLTGELESAQNRMCTDIATALWNYDAEPSQHAARDLRQDLITLKTLKEAEAFYASLGLPQLPEDFWSKSLVQAPASTVGDFPCQASAWDFCDGQDYSLVVQMQIIEYLCRGANHTGRLNECDIFGSEEAGRRLTSILKLGSSKPFPDVMKMISEGRQESIDASATLEYFLSSLERLEEIDERYVGWGQ